MSTQVASAAASSVRPPRPRPAGPASPDAVPAEIREVDQWVVWKHEWVDDRWTKVPYNARAGAKASSTDPRTWSSFEAAFAAYQRGGYDGLGFVFAAEGPYAGVDLDDCVEPDGTIAVDALQHVMDLNSYSEFSPSAAGLKVFLRGRKPATAGCRRKNVPWGGEIEVYDKDRFFTVTGRHVGGTPVFVVERQAELSALCDSFWPPQERSQPRGPARPNAVPDQELLDRMFASASGDKIRRLWNGDTSDHGGDDSAADLALCSHLAFWTGKDRARMEAMFRSSGLYRPKWERASYREPTLDKAVASCREVYQPPHEREGDRASAAARAAGGGTPQHLPEATLDDEGGAVRLGDRDPESGRLVLSPRRTLPTARTYIRQFHTHAEGATLVAYDDQIMEWAGNRYSLVADGVLRHRLQPWLHAALRYQRTRSGGLELVPFEGNATTINSSLEAIRAYSQLPPDVTAPGWLDGGRKRPPAAEILPCRSLNLHVPTRAVLPATPVLFTTNALEFDPDPRAPAPEQWMEFLRQLWGDDEESIQLVKEWFAYALTADTSQQKMFFLVGPRRSGKGTIARVLRALIGHSNVAGPTCASLAGNFGLQPLLDKTFAIVSDARFRGEGTAALAERLLCISGEDAITVDRKFLPAVTRKLSTRFMFLSNELPRLSDASTALAGRFLIPGKLTRTFYGNEDPTLTDKLLVELPGILNWALDGWMSLHERGYFLQPEAGKVAIEELEDLSSPVGAFIRECCEVGPGKRVPVDDLYSRWRNWCEREGRDQPGTKQSFGRDLSAAAPGVFRRRGTGDVAFYEGIALANPYL